MLFIAGMFIKQKLKCRTSASNYDGLNMLLVCSEDTYFSRSLSGSSKCFGILQSNQIFKLASVTTKLHWQKSYTGTVKWSKNKEKEYKQLRQLFLLLSCIYSSHLAMEVFYLLRITF